LTQRCDECLTLQKSIEDYVARRLLSPTEASLIFLKNLGRINTSCPELFKGSVQLVADSLKKRRSYTLVNVLRILQSGLTDLGGTETVERIERVVGFVEASLQRIAENASRIVENGDVLLTHSFSLTVIKALESAMKRGIRFEVYVTESRPFGEGIAMAERLSALGIPVTLIVDSAVRYVMSEIDKVIVGADALASDGSVVGKVGTSQLALAAKYSGTEFIVVAGLYKFLPDTLRGFRFDPEVLSDPGLVLSSKAMPELQGRVKTAAPVLDVTPPRYIDAVVTEFGVVSPQAVLELVSQRADWLLRLRSLSELGFPD